MLAKHIIFGVHINDRVREVPDVQKILTQYGCQIKTRIGLHHVDENVCSPRGLILLEMYGDEGLCEELAHKLAETLVLGGTGILLQGGLNPDLPFTYYEELVRFIRRTGLQVHGFSPPEIVFFAKTFHLSIAEVIRRLVAAGLGSIPGGGAEILVDRVRSELAPNKCSTPEWLEVMDTAHTLGLRTTATMMFGHIETRGERLEHMLRLRELQDRTGGFTAFIPWSFQPGGTALGGVSADVVDYLKTLAISRLVLDNFANVQVSWVTQGAKVAQIALEFGANDFGSTMIEENVVAATGVGFRLSQEEIVRQIKDAGYEARQRDHLYTLL